MPKKTIGRKNEKRNEQIILVNKKDRIIGYEEKLKVHELGKLHRAFSILVFNSKNEMLLQRRASGKYHCANLWTNACCSHPRRNESLSAAAHRRLKEEMGFDCKLKELFSFHYKVKFDNGLIENEIDHVFSGKYHGKIKLNKKECSDSAWVKTDKLKKGIAKNPEKYTPWFRMIVNCISN